MIVAICGSQGLGKSVFIEHLKSNHSIGISAIERKTSRSILSDWNVSLSEVNNDRQLTLKFQDEILARKIADEKIAVESDSLFVTERSYADLFTYATIAIGKDNECSDWLDAYYDKCLEAQKSYAALIYLTEKGRLNGVIKNDGVRGINKHYGKVVDLTMTHFTMTMCGAHQIPLAMVDSPMLTVREQALFEILRHLDH